MHDELSPMVMSVRCRQRKKYTAIPHGAFVSLLRKYGSAPEGLARLTGFVKLFEERPLAALYRYPVVSVRCARAIKEDRGEFHLSLGKLEKAVLQDGGFEKRLKAAGSDETRKRFEAGPERRSVEWAAFIEAKILTLYCSCGLIAASAILSVIDPSRFDLSLVVNLPFAIPIAYSLGIDLLYLGHRWIRDAKEGRMN